MQTTAQGVVAVHHHELAVKRIPAESGLCTVVQAKDQVTAFVVLVMGPGVFTQQVVAPWVTFQRAVELLDLVVQQIARRVQPEIDPKWRRWPG